MSNRIKIQENSVQILSGIHFKYFKVSFKIHMVWTSWALCDTALQKNISRSDLKKVSVIQIQNALWRKLEPLFSRDKKALHFKRDQRKCACIRGQILPTRNNNY